MLRYAQSKRGSYAARRDAPVTLAEQIVLAGWVRDGEPVARMAQQLCRPIPQVRAIVFGEQ